MVATFRGYTIEAIRKLEEDNKKLREMLTSLDIKNNTLVQRNKDLKKGDR